MHKNIFTSGAYCKQQHFYSVTQLSKKITPAAQKFVISKIQKPFYSFENS